MDGVGCPACGSFKLVTDPVTGEVTCERCGVVIVEHGVDTGPDWISRKEEVVERGSARGGPPVSAMFGDFGLSTTFDWLGEDASGRKLSREVREKMMRLKRLDQMSQVNASETKNLQQASSIIQLYADKLNLPQSVTEQAMLIYRKALRAGLIKGRAIRNLAAGAVYAACRLSGIPRDLRDFEKAYPPVRKKTVGQAYRLIIRRLKIKPPMPLEPAAFVPKIASKLRLDEHIVQEVIGILVEVEKRAGKRFMAGKDPVSLAAAALFIACQNNRQNVPQKRVASAAGVTEVTVRNRSRELQAILQQYMQIQKQIFG